MAAAYYTADRLNWHMEGLLRTLCVCYGILNLKMSFNSKNSVTLSGWSLQHWTTLCLSSFRYNWIIASRCFALYKVSIPLQMRIVLQKLLLTGRGVAKNSLNFVFWCWPWWHGESRLLSEKLKPLRFLSGGNVCFFGLLHFFCSLIMTILFCTWNNLAIALCHKHSRPL